MSIFFVIISACVTFKREQDYSGTVFRSAVSRQERKFKFAAVCSRSLYNLRNGHFTSKRTGKKRIEIITAREGRAKALFLFTKYAKFETLSLAWRRRSFMRTQTEGRS